MQLLFSFQGRIHRIPFWLGQAFGWVYGTLVGSLFGLALGVHVDPFDADGSAGAVIAAMGSNVGLWAIMITILIVQLWVGYAISVKRWHDRGKSGWWNLIVLVPLVGLLWFYFECGLLAGTPGRNRYGASPDSPDEIASNFN